MLTSWELEDHHARLLVMAGEAWDRAEAAREVIEKDGATFLDRFKQPKVRPEFIVERDSKILFSRLLRELDLDLEPPADERKRPPALRSIKGGRK